MSRRILVNVLLLFASIAWGHPATAASDVAEFVALPDSPKGGVIVYVGSANAETLIEARDAGRFVVQGVLFDAASVDEAREAILARKAYGLVAVIQGSGKRLSSRLSRASR